MEQDVAFGFDENSELNDNELFQVCTDIEQKLVKKGYSAVRNDVPAAKKRKLEEYSDIEKEYETCIVCQDDECSILFKPCRHLVTCSSCAVRVARCPLCKSRISARIPGLSSMYAIPSKILDDSALIFGRAIITADQSDIFQKSISNYLHTITDESAEDKIFLWFPYFCNRINSNHNYGFPTNVTGVIILEGLHKLAINKHQTFPVGILLIRLPRYARKCVILQSFITKSDLSFGHCQIIWLSAEDVINFSNFGKDNNNKDLSWSYLIYKAKMLVERKTTKQTICPGSAHMIHDTISLISEFQLWIERSNLFGDPTYILNAEEKGTARALTHIERLWLFGHLSCRLNKEFLLTSKLLTLLLSNIYVDGKAVEPEYIIERITEKTAAKCAAISIQDNIPHMMLQTYHYLFECFKTCVEAYRHYIANPIEEIQCKYSAINLFIGHSIDKTITYSISKAPTNPFDCKKVIEWCKEMNQYINDTYSPHKIFGDVFVNMKCIEEYKKPFLLYDMLESNTEQFSNKIYQIKKEKMGTSNLAPPEFPALSYHVVSGNLSEATLPPILRTITDDSRIALLEVFHHLTATQHKIIEAAISRTPTWRTHKNGKSQFHRVIPTLANNNRNSSSVTDILRKYVYPTDNCDAYAHEIINSRLHISTIILDIDLKPGCKVQNVDQSDFIRDLIQITETVLKKCNIYGCTHYIYQSNRRQKNIIKYSDDKEKYGFHHHIKLPFDTVFSVLACKQFVEVLNEIRYLFPKTVGMSVTNPTDRIFDTGIYSEHSFHSIRGPYQSKEDGSSRLECVFRSDGGDLFDIPLFHKLAHAPHIDPKTQMYVSHGRVIKKFTNIQLIHDEIFLKRIGETSINTYAQKMCHTSINGIMTEINNRCILFTNACCAEDIERLESIANDLWKISKKEVVKRMNIPKHDEYIYSSNEIHMINSRVVFKHNPNTNCLSMGICDDNFYKTIAFKLPFCPMRAHHNPVTNTLGYLGYDKHMIRLGLFIHCFKESCNGKHFMPDGHLVFEFPFFASSIKKQINRYLSFVNRSKHKIIEINEDYEKLYVNTNNIEYNTLTENENNIQQLYAFVNDLYGYFLLYITHTTRFVAILIHHNDIYLSLHHITSPRASNGLQKVDVFTCTKDPLPLISHLYSSTKISRVLHNNILKILMAEKHITEKAL